MRTTLLFLSVIVLASCQKDAARKPVARETTITGSIAAGDDYLLQLAAYGDEGDVANITSQPLFAATSKLENETDMFTTVYHYASFASAGGKTDHVAITIHHFDGDSSIIYLAIDLK